MENWIQIGNNQKNKMDRFREDERSYIVQGLVSVWITGKGLLQTNSDDVRMRQIVKYVGENRQNHVSLSELADELFTATYIIQIISEANWNEICRVCKPGANLFCSRGFDDNLEDSYENCSG